MNPKLVLLILLALVTTSCSDSSSSDYTYEDYVVEFSATFCARAVTCGNYPDVASCLKSGKSTLGQFTADVEAGLVTFDLQAGRDCLEKVANSTCTAVASPECVDTTGTVAIGGQCFRSYSCIGEARCDGAATSTCTPGVCAAKAAAGEACLFDGECSSGLVCSFSEGTCAAPAGLDEDCSDVSCVGDYSCGLDGFCAAYANTGTSCNSVPCLQTRDFCDQEDLCSPRIEVGQNCAVGECVGYADCVVDICVARPGEGESCDDIDGASCLGNTSCENGLCVLPPSLQICS